MILEIPTAACKSDQDELPDEEILQPRLANACGRSDSMQRGCGFDLLLPDRHNPSRS
jgi:hypothetical protein